MPGSAENPVRIGPFRRIVEVGWPARWYAFTCFLGNETETSAATPCTEPDVIGDNGYAASYLTDTSMEISAGSVFRFVGDVWEPVTGASVENVPVTPFENTFGAGEAAPSYVEPHRLVLSGSGSIADAPPPRGFPAEAFVASTALGYEVIGLPLDSGGGTCVMFSVDFTFISYPPAGPHGAVKPAQDIGLAAFRIVHGIRQYEPVGVFLVPNEKGANTETNISAPVSARVLCQLVQVTA